MGILGRNYLHTLVSNFVLKFGIGLVIGVVTARGLGPAGRGEYALLALIITTVTTLLNFGIPGTNTYFTAQKRFGKELLYKASIILALVISVVSFVILYLLYQFNLFYILFPADKLSLPIIASLGIIPIVLFNLFGQSIIVGENKIVLNNYITLSSQSALAITLAFMYVMTTLTVTTAIVAFALSHLLAFAIVVKTSFPRLSNVLRAHIPWHDYRTMLTYSITLHVGNLTQFFNYRLDAFIVNYFLGTAAVGLYLIASALGETLWLVSGSMANVLLPTIAGQHEKSKEIAVKAAIGIFVLSLVGGALAFLVGPTLIPLLFGKEFIGSVAPFLILVPGVVIFTITNVLSAYLAGVGKVRYTASISFISFLFTVFLDIFLIPRYGIEGAAIASFISYALSTALTMTAFMKASGLMGKDIIRITKSMSLDFRSIFDRLQEKIKI
jgi:O-antigen/teichoic acid export membrane protein